MSKAGSGKSEIPEKNESAEAALSGADVAKNAVPKATEKAIPEKREKPRVARKRKVTPKKSAVRAAQAKPDVNHQEKVEKAMPHSADHSKTNTVMLTLLFNNLTAGGNAVVELDEHAQWSLGYGEVGLSMSLPSPGDFKVESLRITPSTLTIRLGDVVPSLPITIYAETTAKVIAGQVILPDGSSVIIQSPASYTSVLAGSWAIEV